MESDDDGPPSPAPSKFELFGGYVKRRYDNRLFPHQIKALQLLEKWFLDKDTTCKTAVVVMPTGSGKTGVICCLPYTLGAVAKDVKNLDLQKPVLIVSPDLAIQDQLEKNLHPVAGADEAFLSRRKIVPKNRGDIIPNVRKIDQTKELCGDILGSGSKNIILTNAQKWHVRASSTMTSWEELKEDTFSIVIVDEAHHLPAPQWKRIINKFSKHAKVAFFTATPFRSDGRAITDSIGLDGYAYRLERAEAIRRNIIRDTQFHQLPLDGDVTPEATAVNVMILQKVNTILNQKNKFSLPGGKQHMAIAIVKDKAGADSVALIWNESAGYGKAAAYHSDCSKRDRESIMEKLYKGELRLLVIVAMLLEGFDFPPISVAAIITHIQSPVKFAQFIGRAQRVVRAPPDQEEQGGIADIVTHEYYEQSTNYDMFVKERLIPAAEP